MHVLYSNLDIREEIGERHQRTEFDELVSRKHFITRQDCRNACHKIRDFTNHRHNNDAISVDRIVQELQLENPSPIIAYKPPGILKEEYALLRESNFLVVLMTPFQADLFRSFCSLACVDSTHKTNEYGYKLITLVVADEYRNGNKSFVKCRNMFKYSYFIRSTSGMGNYGYRRC